MVTIASEGAETIHLRTCPLCECMCGMQIHVSAEQRVTLIRPDRDDVWSKGYICPKGTTLGKLHDDPDRIRMPLVRERDQWREVDWPEAFARCEELIAGVLDREIGQSYRQVAMRGRSLHRSQDLGMLQEPGPSAIRLALLDLTTPVIAELERLGEVFAGKAKEYASVVKPGNPAVVSVLYPAAVSVAAGMNCTFRSSLYWRPAICTLNARLAIFGLL